MITKTMSNDHRVCDTLFENIESTIDQNDFTEARQQFKKWMSKNINHFKVEEEVLFPKLKSKMGVDIPPVMMMKMEHNQIRDLIERMEEALRDKDKETFLGLADSCFMLIQQHNMKEEQILYPIIDQAIPYNEEEIQLLSENLNELL